MNRRELLRLGGATMISALAGCQSVISDAEPFVSESTYDDIYNGKSTSTYEEIEFTHWYNRYSQNVTHFDIYNGNIDGRVRSVNDGYEVTFAAANKRNSPVKCETGVIFDSEKKAAGLGSKTLERDVSKTEELGPEGAYYGFEFTVPDGTETVDVFWESTGIVDKLPPEMEKIDVVSQDLTQTDDSQYTIRGQIQNNNEVPVEVDALVQYYDEFTAAEKIDKIVSHQEEISLNVPEGETKGFDGQDLAGVEAEPDDYEVVISWASSIKELDT